MLRALLLALVAANGFFLAWAQGWLAPTWPGPQASQSEPQRLASQVRPEWVQVLPAVAASASVAAARQTGLACVETGPLDAASLQTLQAALAAAGVPATRWAVTNDADGAPWLRVAQADTALRALLQGLPASVEAAGFKPCRSP